MHNRVSAIRNKRSLSYSFIRCRRLLRRFSEVFLPQNEAGLLIERQLLCVCVMLKLKVSARNTPARLILKQLLNLKEKIIQINK